MGSLRRLNVFIDGRMVPRELDDNDERRACSSNYIRNPRLQPRTARLHVIRNPNLRIIRTIRLLALLHRSIDTLQERRKMGLVRHAGHRRHCYRRNDHHDHTHERSCHSQHNNDHTLDSWVSSSRQRNPQQALIKEIFRRTLSHEGSLSLLIII